jgi:pilus assembly protein CpaE
MPSDIVPAFPSTGRSCVLPVALIVPNVTRRRSLAAALVKSPFTIAREFEDYPSSDDLLGIARLNCHVVIVDLGGDVEQGLRAIEDICRRHVSTTVIAYSSRNDSALMRRSMQAGAREFLFDPLLPEAVAEAFALASARRPDKEKAAGKTMVFVGSKAGVGATTCALNFALALHGESEAKVVVVDLDFQLGEIALGLGLTAGFSVVDALVNPRRLDKDFLSTLLLRHSSGLAVLASPEEYDFFHSPVEGAGRLFDVLREEFDYVVVDAGTCHSHIQETLFGIANTIYLVTEMTFPALRNAHRLIAFLSARDASRRLEVVLNRFNSRQGDIDENSVIKTLARPVNWRIPNGYSAAQAAQNSGIPLAMSDSAITRALRQMAKAACGKPLGPEKKSGRGFTFFGSKAMPVSAEI